MAHLVFDGERRTADTFGARLWECRSVSKSQHIPGWDEKDENAMIGWMSDRLWHSWPGQIWWGRGNLSCSSFDEARTPPQVLVASNARLAHPTGETPYWVGLGGNVGRLPGAQINALDQK